MRAREAGKQPRKLRGQDRVVRHGTDDLGLTYDLLFHFARHEGWIEVDYAPPARLAVQRHPVMHLARIQRNHVTRGRIDEANPAP
jgi:hypothetical protein